MADLDGYLTVSEVAAILGVSQSAIGNWIRNGVLAAAHKLPGVSGPYLLELSEVERFADERAKAAS